LNKKSSFSSLSLFRRGGFILSTFLSPSFLLFLSIFFSSPSSGGDSLFILPLLWRGRIKVGEVLFPSPSSPPPSLWEGGGLGKEERKGGLGKKKGRRGLKYKGRERIKVEVSILNFGF